MSELKLKDFVDEESLKKVHELDDVLKDVSEKYKNAVSELKKGLEIDVKVKGDADKLITIFNQQSRNAAEASGTLTEALRKQTEVAGQLTKRIEEKAKSENLSVKEAKEHAKALAEVSKTLQQNAKAEEALHKAENAANRTKRATNVTEKERLKIIREALVLADKEVHSRIEAKEVNKELRRAVDLLKDTDEDYNDILGKLNATIGVNTDYIKRNSDRYTQQKMTVGDYKEQVKQAWMELQTGNDKMKNMGIIASSVGGVLRSNLSAGMSQVTSGVTDMVKGFVGAQAVLAAIQKLLQSVGSGFKAIISFEAENSKLAAILGTTSEGMKELTTDARRLGAATKYTASQATELQIELAKLGFTRTEILQATESVLKFAQATGAELGEAASLAGAAVRMFGATTKETERYVSAMAVSTSRSALSFSYLATALPIVGPVAKAFNFTIEDTLALVGKLADAGFDASMAATATRNIFLNLADSGGKLAKALGKPVKNIEDLTAGLIELRSRGVDLNTTLELTDKRSVAAFNAFLTSADSVAVLREQVTGVDKELNDMATTMGDNVQGAIFGLESAWEAFMLSFYGSKGIMKDVIDFLTRGVRNLADDMKGVSQKQSEADNSASAKAQKELSGSDYLQKNVDNLKRLYKEYVDAGMSAAEAEKKAKDEYIESLRSRFEEENREYEKAISRRKELEDELNGRGFWETLVSWKRTDKVIKGEINDAILAAAGKKGLSSITESVIGDLEKVSLAGSTSDKKPLKLISDEQRKAILAAESSLRESKIQLMDEGFDKEVESIRSGYKKRIDAIKGENQSELELRKSLQMEMEKRISEFTDSYHLQRNKADLQNRLASVKKESEEELALRVQLLDIQKAEEIRNAESNGADISLINEKYLKMRNDLLAEYAHVDIEKMAENASVAQIMRTESFRAEMRDLDKQYALKEIKQEEYEKRKGEITERYAIESARAAVKNLEDQLSVSDLGSEDRESLTKKLQDAKIELASKEADAEIDAIKRVEKYEEKSYKSRMKNAQQWLNVTADSIDTIVGLASAMMDADIKRIEDQQEANDEALDKDIARIEQLEENKVITKEQAEARKRAAEEKSAKKNKELEEQKSKIQQKQAKWEKANSVIQAGIATALAVTRALPNLVLAGIVAAMGAAQVATIVASPIPAYAKGTKGKGHPGGLALVGDGGRQEIVIVDGTPWITPDKPTVVDLPKGAEVYPDVNRYISEHGIEGKPLSDTAKPLVVNDYSGVEKKIDTTNSLLAKAVKASERDKVNLEYESFKNKYL